MGWSKKEVDHLMFKATQRVFVQLENLNSEQIDQLIADLKTKKAETPPPRGVDESDEPCAKKQKFNDKGKDVLKLVLSREGESDTFKSKFKSTLYSRIVDESSDDPSSPYSANESELENPAQYGNATSEKEVPEITATVENHNSSSVDDNLPKDTNNVQESSPNDTDSLVGKIWIRDLRSMMTEAMLERFYIVFGDLGQKPAAAPTVKGVTVTKPTNYIKSDLSQPSEPPSTKGTLELSDVVKIYCKYFSKHVQDTIVIIANILNIISLSNKHHKARMDESFKKRSEAEKLKERCDANRIHEKHKQVLETQLKLHFVDVVSKISVEDFDCTFQMFFLSILTVLRVLDQPKFKKGSIFKNLVLLLWNSLRSCNLEHRKVFTMFRSKSFRPDCIELISLIEDSRETYPDIMDRLALFFISTMDTKDFQSVIEAVTSDTGPDVLATLLEEASKNVRKHSKLVEPNKRIVSPVNTITTSSTTTTTTNNHPTPTVPAINPKVSNDMIKHWVLTKAPNGTYQPLAMGNDFKAPRVIVSTNGDTALHAIAPLNTFYENFSNTLMTNASEVTVPVQTATKLTVATPTSVTSGTLVPGKFVAYNPKNRTVKPITAANTPRGEAATIMVGNKQYQVFRSHVRTLTTAQGKTNGIVLTQQVQKPTEGPIKCFTKNCNEVATIMCSTCTSVKYCSHNCQRVDWYENHIHNCEQLQKLKQSSQSA